MPNPPLPLPDSALDSLLACLQKEDGFVFLETTKTSATQHRSFLFRNPTEILTFFSGDEPKDFFAKLESFHTAGNYLAGWLSFEFGYLLEPSLHEYAELPKGTPMAQFGVYQHADVVDHTKSLAADKLPWPQEKIPAEADYNLKNLRPNQGQQDYIACIERVKRYIESGDTYQVNYTLKLLFDFSGSPEALYRTLRQNQSVAYGAYMRFADNRILSFSPELFFHKQKNTCTVRPMKGTVQRGRTLTEDNNLQDFLRDDLKNRSENVMIVDLLRNDLGRICEKGSVETLSLFDVETYETLHQMTSTVQGKLQKNTSLADLFGALFPCGSVTGAPKIRTMEIIHELENGPRGVYTGGIGFIAPNGEAAFNVPIRTVRLNNEDGEMGIGSGVVYDSDAEQEWQECLLKGKFLTNPAPKFELIETLRWDKQEGYWFLDLHLNRLAEAATFFGYAFNKGGIIRDLEGKAGQFTTVPHRVRLTLAKDGTSTITGIEVDLAQPALNFGQADDAPALSTCFSTRQTDASSPFLYHKTTIRRMYNREYEAAMAKGHADMLFTNEKGEVTEGCISNLFIRKGQSVYTPPVSCGLLNGVLRRHLMSQEGLGICEKVLTREEVENAEAIYLGNSVRGLMRVELRD